MSFTITAGKAITTKDPNAVLDYTIDFTAWLDGMSDSIVNHQVLVDGVTCDSSVVNDKSVVMWISGGEVGATASATARVTTAGGRTDDRSIYFKIKER